MRLCGIGGFLQIETGTKRRTCSAKD